jgi:hypothetical protein
MTSASGAGAGERLFPRPTSVILYGPSEPLVDWVALAFASAAEGGYHWTEVRSTTEEPHPLGPVARGVIPPENLRVRDPRELAADNVTANAAITSGILLDEEATALRRLADFLRLPSVTRDFIASRPRGGAPVVLVVSNAHQLVPQYSEEAIRPILQTVVAHGFVVFASFAGPAGPARRVFDNVWHLGGENLSEWRSARLDVEHAVDFGPLRAGSSYLLGEMPSVVSFFTRTLDDRP